MSLLNYQNAKTVKGEKLNYLTGILYLAPSNMVEGINVCKFASKGCREACLFSAGRGAFSNVKAGRIRKTILFRDNKQEFFTQLIKDIEKLERKAAREGLIPVVRLNGTSDISFEDIEVKDGLNIFDLFPRIQFYDYTKNFTRKKALQGYIKNYHLTFSLSEGNKKHAIELSQRGVNVAVVFRKSLPEVWNNRPVIDADKHDLRFLDGKGKICGLIAKGKARHDVSGFVQN
jgi:hypothetical protein